MDLQLAESLTARLEAVQRALWARNEELQDRNLEWYSLDVLDDMVIVRQGRLLLRVPYSFNDQGVAVFGAAQPVELELEPVEMSADELQLLEGEDPEGWVWDVVVIAPGWSKHQEKPAYFSARVLQEALPLFNTKVFAFPETSFSHHKNPLKKRPDRIVGVLSQARIGEKGEVRARLEFVQAGLADALRKKLVQAWKAGKRDVLGLSIDARGHVTKQRTPDGREGLYVQQFAEVLSTELVVKPAAGGMFTQLVADLATHTEESPMKERLWKLLQARRPEALKGLDEKTVTVEQLLAAIPEPELDKVLAPASTTPAPEATQLQQDAQEVRQFRTTLEVGTLLQASSLPELAQKRVRKRFENQVATGTQIQAAIDEERSYLAELMPARPNGVGGARPQNGVSVGAEKIDRLQAALDRAFGLVPENADLKTIAPIGLRRLYDEITLGQDEGVSGVLQESTMRAMLQEDFTNTTLPRVVANTLYRRLMKDYREVDYKERNFFSVRPGVKDFKTQEVNRVGYFVDIPTVNPESADYAELAAYAEEFESYAVGQKGAKVTITRKHIINDDIGAVAKVTGRLGRAARRTFAKFIYGFFTTNANMQDGVAWFHATHANLRTVALSIAELVQHDLLLYNQVELTSGEKLASGLHHLLIPKALEDAAININKSMLLPGSPNNDANRWHKHFGENNERIVVVPFFSDANDYFTTTNPADVDIIEVAFLNGQEEPELWVADNPTVGQMFTADKLVYKIRHEYGGVPVDFRGVTKAAVV